VMAGDDAHLSAVVYDNRCPASGMQPPSSDRVWRLDRYRRRTAIATFRAKGFRHAKSRVLSCCDDEIGRLTKDGPYRVRCCLTIR
jgi:hypothetical protein